MACPDAERSPGLRGWRLYGQGGSCGSGDLLSALQPPSWAVGMGVAGGVWEQVVMPGGQEQTSTTTRTVGQRGE